MKHRPDTLTMLVLEWYRRRELAIRGSSRWQGGHLSRIGGL